MARGVIAIVVAVAACLFVAAQCRSVVETKCQDGSCSTGCKRSKYDADECLPSPIQDESRKYICSDDAAMCTETYWYLDSSCTRLRSTMNLVCSSCQKNYTVSCGGLHNALWWLSDCSDNECENCGKSTRVPFGQCTFVSGAYVIAKQVFECTAVTVRTFPDTKECSGDGSDFGYPSNLCRDGVILQCLNDTLRQH